MISSFSLARVAILCSGLFTAMTPAVAESPTAKETATLVELKSWLAKPRKDRPDLEKAEFAKASLTRDDAAVAKQLLWQDYAAMVKETRIEEMKAKVIELDGKKMKFEMLDFPAKPEDQKAGRALFISMHGGGGAPPQVNESQWKNQIALGKGYKPTEGIYLAPRAPTDTWNLWHEGHIDTFFDRIIQNLVVLANVNPNRVYILGYSAGGDGVYQLAPRMADRWAAASMMAGHPNETTPVGLRNVPFALQVGGDDAAFKRNQVGAEWGKKLDDLQKADPKGYEHMVEIHAGKPHWMNMEDRKAIPWMEKYTRNALPEKIVWRQDDRLHLRQFWLAVPKESAAKDQEITAERRGQTFTLTSSSAKTITVLFNDSVADFDKSLVIKAAEKELFSGKPTRTIRILAKTLSERGDPDLIFSAEQTVTLP